MTRQSATQRGLGWRLAEFRPTQGERREGTPLARTSGDGSQMLSSYSEREGDEKKRAFAVQNEGPFYKGSPTENKLTYFLKNALKMILKYIGDLRNLVQRQDLGEQSEGTSLFA